MYDKKRLFITFIIFCLLQLLPATTPAARAQDPVAEIMSRMSVEDKVGQLFLAPFVGADVNPGSEVWQLITEYKVGGIILLTANSNFNNDASAPRQIAEITNVLKTTAFHTNGIPLFVAIDQEGDGFPFTRITGGVTPIPSQMAIGATWDPGKAQAIGEIMGEELSAMGINMLLGPGLDVLNDPRPTGRGDIGIRVFGGDPYWVSQLGRAYIRGVHRGSNGGVATVAKHFPGHGGSDRLPDNEVATVDKSLQELRRIELPPFFHVTASLPDDPLGVTDALMSSHIRYRGFQGDIRQFTAPISFDADGMRTLTTLPEIAPWRENNGLIVSDALGVPAVRRHFDPSLESFPHRRIAKDAFLAGNDVLSLVQFDLKSIWSDQFANIKDTIFFFRSEYNNNPAFAARVDAAVERILRLKLKLYPQVTLDALNVDPHRALSITSQPRPVVNEIARQSLTLLYPSPEELRLRLPESPRPGEKMLIITDLRYARECFTSNCEPRELFLPRTTIEETILRLYGPNATGQIQPENISSISYSELKLALGGSLEPSEEELAEEPTENKAVQLSAEEVRDRIKAANWLIFAALDLNASRYSDSDALKLFLSQESGLLRDKKTIVLAFNAPYYLDTTEVTKLTAYYGVYSKTRPHIEVAVRALFGEVTPAGAPSVSVEGIGYNLANALAPDADQSLPLKLVDANPEDGLPPIEVTLQIGPILDYNGNPVPDETPVEVTATINNRQIASAIGETEAALAEATLILNEPGEIQLSARAGQATTERPLTISIAAPPTPTPQPDTPTATPTATALPTDTPAPTGQPQATPAPANTPTPEAIPETEADPPAPVAPNFQPRRPDGVDLLSALSATLLAGLLGFWLGQQQPQPLPGRVRLGLWVLIGGLLAYLFYGAGWLRPEQWLLETPNLLAGRVAVAGLAFIFGLAALGVSARVAGSR